MHDSGIRCEKTVCLAWSLFQRGGIRPSDTSSLGKFIPSATIIYLTEFQDGPHQYCMFQRCVLYIDIEPIIETFGD